MNSMYRDFMLLESYKKGCEIPLKVLLSGVDPSCLPVAIKAIHADIERIRANSKKRTYSPPPVPLHVTFVSFEGNCFDESTELGFDAVAQQTIETRMWRAIDE